jgi:hypothetical protein
MISMSVYGTPYHLEAGKYSDNTLYLINYTPFLTMFTSIQLPYVPF